ncbi:MAG: hypothetical protein JKY54_06065 [Flavobacteriales bacterium]|nr:hypothetical protein [Flavobacteriales bacterium]
MSHEHWRDSTEPLILKEGEKFSNAKIISIDPLGGNVQFQFMNAAGTWITPPDAAYTVSIFSVLAIPRVNMPDTRIIATGGARFMLSGIH